MKTSGEMFSGGYHMINVGSLLFLPWPAHECRLSRGSAGDTGGGSQASPNPGRGDLILIMDPDQLSQHEEVALSGSMNVLPVTAHQ